MNLLSIKAPRAAIVLLAVSATACNYDFNSAYDIGETSVSYTGQTKRQILITDLVDEILAIPNRPIASDTNIVGQLDFYFDYEGGTSDGLPYAFSLSGESLLQGATYGDISSGKNLSGKIAGNDPALIGGEFFGWNEGLDTSPTPEELVDYFFAELEATAKSDPIQLVTAGGPATISTPYLTDEGVDYRQLIQKFLLGAVTFSQGTADYLSTDFRAANLQEGTKPYSAGEHNWDEAYGYFGGARDYTTSSDDEIASKGGRADRSSGYFDSNGDGLVDLTSEINFGNSTNCAKRDRGTASNSNPTDFTTDVFNAFYYGRLALNVGAIRENIGNTELVVIESMAAQAAITWEKCIAATVVHYINDITGDIGNFSEGQFADDDNFVTYAKHWAEMKGFALGLQFSPFSPFRNGDVEDVDVDTLKTILSLMGDGPVMPDGTQRGTDFSGGVQGYLNDLSSARALLQQAYDFDGENVSNW